MKKVSFLGIACLLLVFAAIAPALAQTEHNSLTLNITGLNDVSPAHLEGWAIFGDEKRSTGKFAVEDGVLTNLDGEPQDTFTVDFDLSIADSIVVTIEPEGDTDSEPSGVVLMSGPLNGNSARLDFPVDFGEATGTYILATPSNGPETDEVSGIWFLELPLPPNPGLTLPELPSGWVYEGWAVNQGVPITSGRFTSAEGEDAFSGYSSDQGFPPFPGEDFLLNAPDGVTFPLNLADGSSKVVVSVEPDIGGEDPTGPAPFAIKPLVGDVPTDAADHVNYDMELNLQSVPSGFAATFADLSGEVENLEGEVDMLEETNAMLQQTIDDLQASQSDLENSVGMWQMLSAVTAVVGIIVGAAVGYLGKR